jgi:DNA-binding NarL/FixJ family response regulator
MMTGKRDLPESHQALPLRTSRIAFAPDESSAAVRLSAETPRILIVEDDFLVATEMENALVDAGFEVVGVASSAEEAIALALEHRPILAVMDVHLGTRRDGVEAALELFSHHNIRCIFATAHIDTETRRRAEPALPLGWIAKPYTMISLVALVETVVTQLGGVEQ